MSISKNNFLIKSNDFYVFVMVFPVFQNGFLFTFTKNPLKYQKKKKNGEATIFRHSFERFVSFIKYFWIQVFSIKSLIFN